LISFVLSALLADPALSKPFQTFSLTHFHNLDSLSSNGVLSIASDAFLRVSNAFFKSISSSHTAHGKSDNHIFSLNCLILPQSLLSADVHCTACIPFFLPIAVACLLSNSNNSFDCIQSLLSFLISGSHSFLAIFSINVLISEYFDLIASGASHAASLPAAVHALVYSLILLLILFKSDNVNQGHFTDIFFSKSSTTFF
jgi:hypothetical protein